MTYHFVTDCIGANGPDINAMTEAALDVTRRTFLRHVDQSELADIAEGMGYCWHPSQGLTMAADWTVSYHRSRYCGRRCYFLKWSAIEYVFV